MAWLVLLLLHKIDDLGQRKVHAKLVEVWNIYDTTVSIIFPVGLFISFCCVILGFTFWQPHSYKHKPLFPEKQILLFVVLFLSLSSVFLLSLPFPCHKHSLFFPFLQPLPLILMCWVVFSCCFSVCLLSELHQKYWATPSQ